MNPRTRARVEAVMIRRLMLATRIPDMTLLHDDGTKTVYRGRIRWHRRAWITVRLWSWGVWLEVVRRWPM